MHLFYISNFKPYCKMKNDSEIMILFWQIQKKRLIKIDSEDSDSVCDCDEIVFSTMKVMQNHLIKRKKVEMRIVKLILYIRIYNGYERTLKIKAEYGYVHEFWY